MLGREQAGGPGYIVSSKSHVATIIAKIQTLNKTGIYILHHCRHNWE